MFMYIEGDTFVVLTMYLTLHTGYKTWKTCQIHRECDTRFPNTNIAPASRHEAAKKVDMESNPNIITDMTTLFKVII